MYQMAVFQARYVRNNEGFALVYKMRMTKSLPAVKDSYTAGSSDTYTFNDVSVTQRQLDVQL